MAVNAMQATLSGLERRLEALEAEAAIRRLMAAHAWLGDSGSGGLGLPDWDSCGAEGPHTERELGAYWVADGGVWEGSGLSASFDGFTRIEMADFRSLAFSTWIPRMMHFLTNEQIEINSPTEAHGRWYSWEAATVLVDAAYEAIWIAGRYDCAFSKERGEWKIRSVHFQEVFSVPVGSGGWIDNAHVPYGPRQAHRCQKEVSGTSDRSERSSPK